ncbi:unnamed protein product, partial [Closterium sp. NIES-54]
WPLPAADVGDEQRATSSGWRRAAGGGRRAAAGAMSVVPRESVQVAAHSIGIASLGDDVAAALAPDVEYRMREIIQEAVKCMRHSRSTTLTTAHIAAALSLRNVEPLFGLAAADSVRFRRAVGHSDVVFLHDPTLPLSQVVEARVPCAPADVSVAAHWLAVDGTQPATPENAPPAGMPAAAAVKAEAGRAAEGSTQRATGGAGGGAGGGEVVEVKLPIKHVLSKELQVPSDPALPAPASHMHSSLARRLSSPSLFPAASLSFHFRDPFSHSLSPHQPPPPPPTFPPPPPVLRLPRQLYFERVTELVLLTARPAPPATSSAPSPGGQQQQSVLSHALRSVAVDAGLHALLPYLVHFIADEASPPALRCTACPLLLFS